MYLGLGPLDHRELGNDNGCTVLHTTVRLTIADGSLQNLRPNGVSSGAKPLDSM